MTSYIIIPARLASTRLPRKLLLRDTGKTVLQHTYEAAREARHPLGVCVAADHEEIVAEVRAFGGQAYLTSPDHPCGTDRIAECARLLPRAEILVNVQGDEPELAGEAIDQVIELLESDPDAVMATLATPIRSREKLLDPSCVKVVCDARGRAIYFSRSPIPHAREWDDSLLSATPAPFLQHIGLYAYRRDFLMEFTQWPQGRLEQIEKLEQLRVIEAGRAIQVGLVESATRGIDTLADYEAFVERMLQLT